MKSIVFWIRASAILLMALIFYPCIYLFGFIMSIPCWVNPHKSGIHCIGNFNKVFEK